MHNHIFNAPASQPAHIPISSQDNILTAARACQSPFASASQPGPPDRTPASAHARAHTHTHTTTRPRHARSMREERGRGRDLLTARQPPMLRCGCEYDTAPVLPVAAREALAGLRCFGPPWLYDTAPMLDRAVIEDRTDSGNVLPNSKRLTRLAHLSTLTRSLSAHLYCRHEAPLVFYAIYSDELGLTLMT